MTGEATLYIDYRSPYSYLAKAEALALERDFGVPSFVLDDELFWGADRIWLLRERLTARRGRHQPPRPAPHTNGLK